MCPPTAVLSFPKPGQLPLHHQGITCSPHLGGGAGGWSGPAVTPLAQDPLLQDPLSETEAWKPNRTYKNGEESCPTALIP